MQTRQLLVFVVLSLVAAGAVMAAVSIYHRSNTAQVETPAVNVETNKPDSGTTVDAPYTHIEDNKEGTKIEAPGVKIEIPKSPSSN